MADIPLQILIDIVHPNNKWELILIQNQETNKLVIKKGIYYYDVNDINIFKNQKYSIKPFDNDLKVHLGEFRPLLTDMMYLTLLPIGFNGNEFIVNVRTKIVYIKPMNVTLMLTKNNTYNFDAFKDYYYGGIFNQYLNADNHTGQLFISIIPGQNRNLQKQNNSLQSKQTPALQQSINQNIINSNSISSNSIPNNFDNNFNKPLNYDKIKSSTSLLGDKLLMSNNYVQMKQPQKFDVPVSEKIIGINKITFVVPFLEKHNNNIEQLNKSLWSIVNNVDNKEILLVTNKNNFELSPDLINYVTIFRYNNYVGTLGFENRLNVIMRNGFDIASFYNNIITNLVKTDTFIIWKYNWEIYNPWNIVEVNIGFPIYHHYKYNGKEYQSKTFSYGIVLDSRKRFSNTQDYLNIFIPGISGVVTNQIIPIKSVYSEIDNLDVKNKITYEDNKELKDFYEKIGSGQIPEYIIKSEHY